jgi:hypothetical protein
LSAIVLVSGTRKLMLVRLATAWLFRLSWVIMACWSGNAFAATCSPATSQGAAPPSWQTYCWLDFSTYSDATVRTTAGQNFSYTLSDGAILTFNVKLTGTPVLLPKPAPSWTGAAVGNTAFLGIPGSPILYSQTGGTNVLTISSILITPPPGAPAVTAYAFVAADAESTNNGESLSFNTNGGGWTVLDAVDPISGTLFPTSAGAGTATFTETGVAGTVGGYIVGSNSPTTVTTTLVGGGLQGAMFAVRFASIRLNKVIGGARVDATDQFKFDIQATATSSVLATGTSTGTSLGPFAAAAVSLASGIPLTITEAMAPGSASTMSHYQSSLNCINGTSGSTTVLPTALTTTSYSFGSLQFGDAIQCTFTNTPFPHISLQKVLGAGGRQFAGDQFILNLNGSAGTVATTTTTGTGSTITTGVIPMTQVTAASAYSLAELPSGTTSLAQYTATLSCANARTGSSTVLPTTLPGSITPVVGDVITCTITNLKIPANANLTAVKSVTIVSDPVNGTTNPKAIPGALVNYTISVTNTGNLTVTAGSIFIDDPLPSTITFNNGIAVGFINGTPSSGLSFNLATDVKFSNLAATPTSFTACTYTPTAGFDANVKHVCVRPSGTMAAGTGVGQPNFSIVFQGRVN